MSLYPTRPASTSYTTHTCISSTLTGSTGSYLKFVCSGFLCSSWCCQCQRRQLKTVGQICQKADILGFKGPSFSIKFESTKNEFTIPDTFRMGSVMFCWCGEQIYRSVLAFYYPVLLEQDVGWVTPGRLTGSIITALSPLVPISPSEWR